MASENQYVHAEKYESSEVKRYARKTEKEPENLAFLFPATDEYFKLNIPGKTVLDIACGKGIWSYKAAQDGAKVFMDLIYMKKWYNWPNKLLHSLVQSIYVLEM